MINKYPSLEGGADREMFNLANLLKKNGHEITIFAADINTKLNPEYQYSLFQTLNWKRIDEFSLTDKLKGFINIVYNKYSKKCLENLLKDYRPDIVHLHNIHFDVSTSVIDALYDAKIPTVMHLHDARLFCPNGFLFTKGRYCNKCFYHKYYNAFIYKCVKNNLAGSLAVSISFYYSFIKKLYHKIDRFIIPTEIVKKFAIESGIPSEKISVIDYPAPLNDWVPSEHYEDYFLFFGQHLPSKGLLNLIKAMRQLPTSIRLLVTGKGILTEEAESLAKGLGNIIFKGFVPDDELKNLIANSLFTVLPSIGFENSNCTIRESNCLGKAVLGSRIGGIPELIIDGETGVLFDPNNLDELTQKIESMFCQRERTIAMGKAARKYLEKNNAPNDYFLKILSIYKELINRSID